MKSDVRRRPVRWLAFWTLGAAALLFGHDAVGEDWALLSRSSRLPLHQPVPLDWYALNRLVPCPSDEATAEHFVDQESIGSSPVAYTNIVRVWERTVFRAANKPYEGVRAEVEREERRRLGRELTVIDMAAVFPHAVNQAAKEVRTLFEINCESGEFIVLQVDLYDVEGSRMISEKNSNMDLWYAVRPGTVMELLAKKVCRR